MPNLDFGNLKDDSQRLNEHTEVAVEELNRTVQRWAKAGIDARAIYSALAVFHEYYYELGADRLTPHYMNKLEEESHKLAQAMKNRDLR